LKDGSLIVDPKMGVAGDMFSAAIISMGVPAITVTEAMECAARPLGTVKVETQNVATEEGPGTRLSVKFDAADSHLTASDATDYLDSTIEGVGLRDPYARFARNALDILIEAEREAHSSGQLDFGELPVTPVGVARTPYEHEASRQPAKGRKGPFYIELFPEYAAGVKGLETFSHIYVISYLHRSPGFSLTVTPPWQEPNRPETVGLFASRSPNRPTPLGLTLAEVTAIEGNRIYTGPLDLFDRTPVLDIKPHLRTLDETGLGNDGWLAQSDHLRLHKEGVPHDHSDEEAVLHEAQDILLDIVGVAKGLQYMNISLEDVICLTPVAVGGGTVRFSHGVLPVPTPAVVSILKRYWIPHTPGPVDVELLTPTGAALLAALEPRWRCRELETDREVARRGLGLGTREMERINGLWLALL